MDGDTMGISWGALPFAKRLGALSNPGGSKSPKEKVVFRSGTGEESITKRRRVTVHNPHQTDVLVLPTPTICSTWRDHHAPIICLHKKRTTKKKHPKVSRSPLTFTTKNNPPMKYRFIPSSHHVSMSPEFHKKKASHDIWVCLKIEKTPKPNGFHDHYPYFSWLFHWED